jgi:hypothetical protein
MSREEDNTSKWKMRNEIISYVLQTRAALGSMVRSYSAIGARRYVQHSAA